MKNKVKVKKSDNKFKLWWNNKALPVFTKLGNQRHLSAIRDAFGTMIPLIIAGGMGMLIDAIIFGGAGSGKVSLLGLFAKINHSWDEVTALLGNAKSGWGKTSSIGALAFGQIQIATIGAMSLYFVFLLGYFLSLSRNFKNPVMAGLISLACFIIASMGNVAFFMDTKGLFTALIVGIGATELFVWFSNMKALEVKLPSGVPPAVGKSFAVFLPVVFTTTIIAIVNVAFLAPAIAINNSSLNVSQYSYLVSTGDVWKTENITFANFATFIGDKNGWNIDISTADGWSQVFGNADKDAATKWLNDFGNASDANQWVNQGFGSNGFLTSAGQGLLSQYILHSNKLDTTGTLEGVNKLIGKLVASKVNGNWEVIDTLRYSVISISNTGFGLGAAVYKFFTSWFVSFATGNGGLGLAVIYVFFISFFWFFGVHGSNIMGAIFEPIWWMILGINTALISSGLPKHIADNADLGVFAKPFFDIYMNVGGSGATLGLLVMVMFFSRRRELREVSKYALPAGCFNINEPVIFGFPLVLNVTYVVPFTLAPLTMIIVAWLFTEPMNAVNVVYVTVPWTTPWILGAILATTDPMSLLIALLTFGISMLIWLPFIILDNLTYLKKLKNTDPEKYEEEYRYIHDKAYRAEYKTAAKAERIEAKNQIRIEAEEKKAAKKAEKNK